MLLQSLLTSNSKPKEDPNTSPRGEYEPSHGRLSNSGEQVSVFSSQCIATAYRAKNIISDAIASIPLKNYLRANGAIIEIQEDPVTRNLPYLLHVSPNLWGWTPFQMKKAFIEWLLFYGNGYFWKPPVSPAQIFVLASSRTRPLFDTDGNLWYEHYFSNLSKPSYIPSVEILHELINPDESGMMGRGVITFARETFGRRQAADKTQAKIYAHGAMPAAIMRLRGEVSKESRDKVRAAYEESMSGTNNAYRLAILDNKIEDYKPVDIKMSDAQWLESISATDDDIALFFGIAGHMLNKGKEAYNSNFEKFEEFKALTLDPLIIPLEEGARIRWVPYLDQGNTYFKFKRESLLRMSPKDRADMNARKIESGQLSPNEARSQDEMSPYPVGDGYYMASNVQPIADPAAPRKENA